MDREGQGKNYNQDKSIAAMNSSSLILYPDHLSSSLLIAFFDWLRS
jgi:hypothetical protein